MSETRPTLPLTGVTLLRPDQYAYNDDLYGPIFGRIARHARELGATIISDPSGQPDFHRYYLLDDPNAFTLLGSVTVIKEATANMYAQAKQNTFVYPTTYDYRDAPEELAPPFVLACRGQDGGQAKYFIENAEQATKVRKLLIEDHSQFDLSRAFEIREWVETPSDRYTSYRTITSPVSVLAAGLLYSKHSKGDDRRISRALTTEPITERTNMWGRSVLNAFEDPRSPYFLNSRDICSNIERGGGCIPLMGSNRRELTSVEKSILSAHGIDPARPALPEFVSRSAMHVATHVGRVTALVIGSDHLQDARQHNVSEFLEVNSGPGLQTWAECWYGGSRELSDSEAIQHMQSSALQSIVQHRSS